MCSPVGHARSGLLTGWFRRASHLRFSQVCVDSQSGEGVRLRPPSRRPADADRVLQQALRASPHPPGGTALEASAGRRAPLYSRPRPRSAPTRVSPSKAAPQGRGRTPVAPPVTAASPLLPRSGSSLAQCVNASPAGRPGRGLLAVPIGPGHSGTRSGGVRPHLRDLPFHGSRRLPLRTPEHPPQRLQAPMLSRPLRSRSFKRAPCSAPSIGVVDKSECEPK
ncbi:hypothetical protein NDU88_004814 [Pleurodeles waltl]|uniref:Uncharacterized protein n=1 Tax=Pleurodeles waltl TaxID=8319 RepID=A0AAV7SJY6_PLEWA|nr:hypothetical protein NDU88_004814 [Pleurodeles waltl]